MVDEKRVGEAEEKMAGEVDEKMVEEADIEPMKIADTEEETTDLMTTYILEWDEDVLVEVNTKVLLVEVAMKVHEQTTEIIGGEATKVHLIKEEYMREMVTGLKIGGDTFSGVEVTVRTAETAASLNIPVSLEKDLKDVKPLVVEIERVDKSLSLTPWMMSEAQ